MANISLPLVSLEQTVYNGIYFTVANDVKNHLRLHQDTYVTVVNSMEVEKTDMRNTVDRNRKAMIGSLSSERRLVVNVDYEYDDKTLGTGYTTELEAPMIFADDIINAYIVPIYTYKNIVFTFNYYSPSKDEINQLRDFFRSILTNAKEVIAHDVEYTLTLPEDVEHIITMFHDLRKGLFPSELSQYLVDYSTPALHSITDFTNPENALLAVKQRQTSIFGNFDTTTPPTHEVDNDRNIHSIEFTYKLHMEMPTRINASFPAVICNQLVPIPLLEKLTENNLKRFEHYNGSKRNHLGYNASVFQNQFNDLSNSKRISNVLYPINIPEFDDYRLDFDNIRGYKTIMTVLCLIDEDKRTLLNLRDDIDPWRLSTEIQRYIKDSALGRVTKYYNSFLYIGLEQEGRYHSKDILVIDDDFNVKSTVDLELHRITRVSIKVCVEPEMLMNDGKREFEENDDIFILALEEMLELDMDDEFNFGMKSLRYHYMVNVIIQTLGRASRRHDHKFIYEIIRVINKNSYVAAEVALRLIKGYPNLTEDLTDSDVFVNDGGIFVHDPNSDIADKEKEHSDNIKKVIGDNIGIIDRIRERGWANPYVSRTRMSTSVLTYRS